MVWKSTANSSVGGWVRSVELDSADSGTSSVVGDSHVTRLSPGGTPGVSEDVVALAILRSVSNETDSVVDGGSAGGWVEDSRSIELESKLDIDSDGDGLLSKSSLNLGLGSWGDVDTGKISDTSSRVLGGHAGLVNSSISVVGLKDGISGLIVVPSPPSSIAGVSVGVTVNELLLGELEELSSGNEVSSLHGLDGGEGPA